MELIIMGTFMCLAFLIGRYSDKETPKKEIIKKPIKIFRKKTDEFKLDEATTTMLENIDNYDGTANNQKDVPEEV